MDWATILVALIGALIPSGGFLALFTMSEKKAALQQENNKGLLADYMALAEERKSEVANMRELLAKKEDELMAQIKMNSSLRHSLDDVHTELAVANLMRCTITKCPNREPPFGGNPDAIVSVAKDKTRSLKTELDKCQK